MIFSKMQKEIFKVGTEVEVTSNIIGFRNSWYKATIIPPPEPNNSSLKPRNKSLWVEYETVFDNEDPSKKLQEFTDTLLIRPFPPIPSKEKSKFEKFDFVDVYCKGGWFTGVLLHVFDDNGFKYLVAFLNHYEEFVYGKDEIRVHLEWLGGCKWGKAYPSQKVNVTFCPPKVGETGVASLPESTPAVVGSEVQAPSPAKKAKRTTSGVAEGRPSSDPNYVVQSVDAPHKFFQPCSLPSSKDDTNITGKMKACDEQNWEDIKKNDDSHSRCPAKGNQITEVIDLTDEPDEVVDKHVLVTAKLSPRKGIAGSSRDTLLYRKVGKSGSGPPSHVLRSSIKTEGSPNPPLTDKRTYLETPGTKLPPCAPDAPESLSGSIPLDRIMKDSLSEKTSSPPAVHASPSKFILRRLSEQPPSPAKKLKRTTSGDVEERTSSDRNKGLQSVDARQNFLQPCPSISKEGNTQRNEKRKASDEKNCSSLSFSLNDNVTFGAPDGGETFVASLLESTPAVVSPVEQAPSPAKKLKRTTSGDAVGRPSSDPNYVVQSVDAPPKFLQPSSFPPSKGDTHSNEKRKASDRQSYSPLSLSPKKEDNKNYDAFSPAKGQVTQGVDAINEPEKVIGNQGDRGSKAPVSSSEPPAATECPKACPVTTCFSPHNSQSWSFTKKSHMWKVYESMEVFKRIPQAPHFSPLNEHEETSREKLALSMMSNFSYEAERISAGSPDDLNTSKIILDSLKSLEELESHGFNISPLQDYLNELLCKMEKEKELKRELEETEKEIAKCQDKKAAIERKVSELAKELKSLQELICYEKSAKHLKDQHLANLESHKDIISRKLQSFQLTIKPPFKW